MEIKNQKKIKIKLKLKKNKSKNLKNKKVLCLIFQQDYLEVVKNLPKHLQTHLEIHSFNLVKNQVKDKKKLNNNLFLAKNQVAFLVAAANQLVQTFLAA